MTHFLQQGHTHSNKATPPKSVTPYEIMEANYVQTTTQAFQSQQAGYQNQLSFHKVAEDIYSSIKLKILELSPARVGYGLRKKTLKLYSNTPKRPDK